MALRQLARVAWSVTSRPSFTKRLILVLRAVSGLVDPSSPTYITEKMLAVMSQMASKRMGDVFGDENLAGVRVAVDLSDLSLPSDEAGEEELLSPVALDYNPNEKRLSRTASGSSLASAGGGAAGAGAGASSVRSSGGGGGGSSGFVTQDDDGSYGSVSPVLSGRGSEA